MKELQDKEQLLMAYYAQYYKGAASQEVKQLDKRLSEAIGEERYQAAMKELEEEGLIVGMEEVEKRQQEEGTDSPMATNEGMLYINNVLNLQSYAVEEHQLDYLENNLKTSGLKFTLQPVEDYIKKTIKQQAEEKPNENSP